MTHRPFAQAVAVAVVMILSSGCHSETSSTDPLAAGASGADAPPPDALGKTPRKGKSILERRRAEAEGGLDPSNVKPDTR